MKKLSLGAALVSALLVSMGANAQTQGASGTINFTGSINADTCVVAGGTSASKNNISVDMGDVSVAAVGTQAAPTTTGTFLDAKRVPISLNLQCASGAKVSLILDAARKNGLDSNSIALDNVGGAGNVSVSLYRSGTTTLIPLSGATPDLRTIDVNLSTDGRAVLGFDAYYTQTAGAPAVVTPGAANATASYVLMYE